MSRTKTGAYLLTPTERKRALKAIEAKLTELKAQRKLLESPEVGAGD